MKKILFWFGVFFLVLAIIGAFSTMTKAAPVNLMGTILCILLFSIANPLLWVGIIFLVVSLLIKKPKIDNISESEEKIKNTILIAVILYGIDILGSFLTSGYLTLSNSPFFVKLLWGMQTFLAILLYVISIPLLFRLKKIGRYLILLSAIIYLPTVAGIIKDLFDLLLNKYQTVHPSTIGTHFMGIAYIVFGLLPFFVFTRPKVKEQFK